MVVTGYRINTTNMGEIYEKLAKVKDKLRTIANREYHRLLGKEIAFLVDQISTNALQRDENVRIIDAAIDNLNKRIGIAETRNVESEYNMSVFAHVLTDGEYTYLKVICLNDKLLASFKGLEDYSLTEIECQDKRNAKTIKWNELHKKFVEMEPCAIVLSQNIIKYDKELIKYPEKMERAETMARHTVLNRILAQISGGEQIPPMRIMEYMEEAVTIYSNSKTLQDEYNEKVTSLLQLMIQIDKHPEIVFMLPREEAAEQEKEEIEG